jgi:glyceraldehyde-3-phosphate dehydrogenase (NADP+)
MAAAFTKAGLPAGLLQVITGKGSEIGDYLTTHPKADCISFTGGDTGLQICGKAGMVPLQMELGGKDVCLVCADADLDLAAKSIIKGGLSYQGQRCTAVKVCLTKVLHKSMAQKCFTNTSANCYIVALLTNCYSVAVLIVIL